MAPTAPGPDEKRRTPRRDTAVRCPLYGCLVGHIRNLPRHLEMHREWEELQSTIGTRIASTATLGGSRARDETDGKRGEAGRATASDPRSVENLTPVHVTQEKSEEPAANPLTTNHPRLHGLRYQHTTTSTFGGGACPQASTQASHQASLQASRGASQSGGPNAASHANTSAGQSRRVVYY